MPYLKNKSDSALATQIMKDYCLCSSCLGRQFPNYRQGLTNRDRGAYLAVYAQKRTTSRSTKKCYICKGLMDRLAPLATKIVKEVKGCEFRDFLVGAFADLALVENEDLIRATFKLRGGEPLKGDFTSELGKILKVRLKKPVSYQRPDLVITVGLLDEEIVLSPRPLVIYLRYRKEKRGMPQKVPRCGKCYGKGCIECNGSGKSKTTSVESIIEKHLLHVFSGEGVKINWIGGEDEESLVLGTGRPIYAQITSPRIRHVKTSPYEEEGVKIRTLKVLSKQFPTQMEFKVTYLVNIKSDTIIEQGKVKTLENYFTDKTVKATNTKGKSSLKRVYELRLRHHTRKGIQLTIICDGGLNIKKLVSGEENMVEPSLSQLLDCNFRTDPKKPFDILRVTTDDD